MSLGVKWVDAPHLIILLTADVSNSATYNFLHIEQTSEVHSAKIRVAYLASNRLT